MNSNSTIKGWFFNATSNKCEIFGIENLGYDLFKILYTFTSQKNCEKICKIPDSK